MPKPASTICFLLLALGLTACDGGPCLALGDRDSGYQVTSAPQDIDAWGTCKNVSSSVSLFAPTKTAAEWNAFIANHPGQVTLNACGPAPTCSDGIQNQGETGVDCGGPCPACAAVCGDAICNGSENCGTCPGDCICSGPTVCCQGSCAAPRNGDGCCNGGENCSTSADCSCGSGQFCFTPFGPGSMAQCTNCFSCNYGGAACACPSGYYCSGGLMNGVCNIITCTDPAPYPCPSGRHCFYTPAGPTCIPD